MMITRKDECKEDMHLDDNPYAQSFTLVAIHKVATDAAFAFNLIQLAYSPGTHPCINATKQHVTLHIFTHKEQHTTTTSIVIKNLPD
jgi:hypothetical protein